MKILKTLFSQAFALVLLASLTSCLKTAAEIEREQELDQALTKYQESSGMMADLTAKNKELQEQVSQLQGKIEELQQNVNGKNANQAQGAHEQLLKMSADMEELRASQSQLQKELAEQKELVRKNDQQLQGLASVPVAEAQTYADKKNSNETSVDEAEKLLTDKKYAETIKLCKAVLESKLSDGKKNRCRFAQGMAYRELKQYDEAVLSLSQIYTDWPKSTLSPNSLLEIGKILEIKKQHKEAQLMFKKLLAEYPKTSAAKEAKKLITSP